MQKAELTLICNNVCEELSKAASGETTSYPFIKHTVSQTSLVADGEIFQVLVIGGSVAKTARMVKRNGRLRLLQVKEFNQPVFDTKERLLTFLEPLIDVDVSHVAINFAYPLNPIFENGRLEGTLAFATKEHTFAGLIGEKVAETIEQYIQEKRNQTIIASVANDTVCLLLSGLTRYSWNQVAAGIVGTGLNFALFLDETTLINLEAANFNKFPQSEEGKIIAAKSQKPELGLFEKEVSGGYLHLLFNERAGKQGIPAIQSAQELDQLMRKGGEVGALAKEFVDRSAHLVACQAVGIAEFLNKDTNFVMEGSLFWKGYMYQQTVEKAVRDLSPSMEVNFIHIPDSGIFGAAKLVA